MKVTIDAQELADAVRTAATECDMELVHGSWGDGNLGCAMTVLYRKYNPEAESVYGSEVEAWAIGSVFGGDSLGLKAFIEGFDGMDRAVVKKRCANHVEYFDLGAEVWALSQAVEEVPEKQEVMVRACESR